MLIRSVDNFLIKRLVFTYTLSLKIQGTFEIFHVCICIWEHLDIEICYLSGIRLDIYCLVLSVCECLNQFQSVLDVNLFQWKFILTTIIKIFQNENNCSLNINTSIWICYSGDPKETIGQQIAGHKMCVCAGLYLWCFCLVSSLPNIYLYNNQ